MEATLRIAMPPKRNIMTRRMDGLLAVTNQRPAIVRFPGRQGNMGLPLAA
jgi:hypothetical protein